MHHTGQLRPLLPKSVSQTRPELFQIQRTFEDKPPIDFHTAHGPLGYLKRKRGQKEKENRGQSGPLDGPKLLNPRRSAAQRGRRQRELAEQIEGLLQTKGPVNFRSQAQTLRRRVEQAEQRLEFDAVCDPTDALNHALDKEFKINNPRREKRRRPSRLEQMIGSEEYHRLLSAAKQSERERRELEGTTYILSLSVRPKDIDAKMTSGVLEITSFISVMYVGFCSLKGAAKSQPEVGDERHLQSCQIVGGLVVSRSQSLKHPKIRIVELFFKFKYIDPWRSTGQLLVLAYLKVINVLTTTFTLPSSSNSLRGSRPVVSRASASSLSSRFRIAVHTYEWMEPAVAATATQVPPAIVGARLHFTRVECAKGSDFSGAVFHGRPILGNILSEAHASAGKVAIVACGPDAFLYDVRNAVADAQFVIADGFGRYRGVRTCFCTRRPTELSFSHLDRASIMRMIWKGWKQGSARRLSNMLMDRREVRPIEQEPQLQFTEGNSLP
ncbi:hypothetical protein DFH09DRAFT_1492027 [Mycena vulgaris]|nr:hypothetical protein DFH09DRAFT_1492027 [Mycena vulgaris]